MEILKSLNLNRNPKDLKSGSLVCAKNMIVDYSSSYLTNEPGFAIGFACPNVGEFIVGCIPCISEIVIFTWNRDTKESKIYRKQDGQDAVEVPTNWKYSGGKITGSFTYNYKKQLIIGVGEYDAYDVEGNLIQVPFKCWNLDSDNVSNSYNIEDTIPKFKVSRYITTSGNLVCGVYTFYIRFKLDEASYTKWFQITDDIPITDSISKEAPNHRFLRGDNMAVVDADVRNFTELFYNSDTISNKAISINIEYLESTNYEKYQIGYVVRHGSDVKGRLYSEFSINETSVNISNNEYSEEIGIDDFSKIPHQFYNVKNVITYNNRLYISNYTEYKNEDLQPYADMCKVGLKAVDEAVEETKTFVNKNIHINTSIYNNSPIDYFVNKVNTYTVTKNGVEYTYITNPKNFIKEFASKINIIATRNNRVDNIVTGYEASYGNSIPVGDNLYLVYEKVSYRLAFFDKVNDRVITIHNSAVSLNDLVDYKLRLVDNTLYLEVDDYSQKFDSTNSTTENPIGLAIEAKIETIVNNTNVGGGYIREEGYAWIASEEGVTSYPTNPKGAFRVFTTLSEESNTIKYDSIISKTFIPGQVYAFYIHYIRKDYSCTNGYPLNNHADNAKDDYGIDNSHSNFINYTTLNGKRLFLCPPSNNGDSLTPTKPCLRLKIIDIKIPVGYIGYFISYEQIENPAIPTLFINKETIGEGQDAAIVVNLTNTGYIYSNDQITGKHWLRSHGTIRYETNGNNKGIIDDEDKEILKLTKYKERLNYPHVIANVTDNGATAIESAEKIILISDNRNVYNKTAKTLYRLTNNIFRVADNQDSNLDNYVPGFYNTEKVIVYNQELIANPTASNVLNKQGGAIDSYAISTKSIKHYSTKPLDAYSILQDYNTGSVSLINNDGRALGTAFNKILSPDRLQSFLELKEAYTSAPLRSYTNYSKNNIDSFDKTIYRSNVVSDESLVNGFREFEIDNYKNIFENKGNIVNIIGIGLYFIVHTEYSIFVFDRTPKLTQKTQLDIPDVFDISYQELLPSSEGFGGISSKEESIISKHGYVWFDKRNRIIFKYSGGQIKPISQAIYNFIKNLDIYTIRFAEDINRNRLLICIYLNEYTSDGEQLTITLSYDFNTDEYISIHDYSFTKNYKTSAVSYLFDENKDRSRLYVYNDKNIGYRNLSTDYNKYFDTYKTQQIIGNEEFTNLNYLALEMADTYYPRVNRSKSLYSDEQNKYSVDEELTEAKRRAGGLEESPQLVALNNGTFSFINIGTDFNVRYTTNGEEPTMDNSTIFYSADHYGFVLNGGIGTRVRYGVVYYGSTGIDPNSLRDIILSENLLLDNDAPAITPIFNTEGTGELRVGATIIQEGFYGTTYYTTDGSDPDENSKSINRLYGDYYVENPTSDFDKNRDYGASWSISRSKTIYYKDDIVIKAITIYGNKRSAITTFNTAEENPTPYLIEPDIIEGDTYIELKNRNYADLLVNEGNNSTFGIVKYKINDDNQERVYTKLINTTIRKYNYITPIIKISAWVEANGKTSDIKEFYTDNRKIFLDKMDLHFSNITSNSVTIKILSDICDSYRKYVGPDIYHIYYTTNGEEPQVEIQNGRIHPTDEDTILYEGEFTISSETELHLTTIKAKIFYLYTFVEDNETNQYLFYSDTYTMHYAPTQAEEEEILDVNEDYVYVPTTKGEGKEDTNTIFKSYVDVILNTEYETPKVLENISYVLNELQYYYLKSNPAEEDLIKAFCGDFIMIYSDNVNTGLINVNTKNLINKLNDYKHPYYEKGKWNFNYFRDDITTPISNEDDKDKPIIIKTAAGYTLAATNNIQDISDVDNISFSDNRSLVYGKYFVVRFVFNNDRKIKLESLDFKINKY